MLATLFKPELRAQLIRFALTGGFVTVLGVAAYWVVATPIGWPPLVANLVGYAVAVLVGYRMHSRFSFRGHGSRDAPAARTVRFAVVSLVSLGLNSLWVWGATGWLHGPNWWPIPLMVGVTPLVTFTLNRQWVFR